MLLHMSSNFLWMLDRVCGCFVVENIWIFCFHLMDSFFFFLSIVSSSVDQLDPLQAHFNLIKNVFLQGP